MADTRPSLAERKQLLIARSTLQRLTLQSEAMALKQSLFTPRSALSLAASAPMRSLLLSGIVFAAGAGRISRLVRAAMAVLTVAKAARALAAWASDRRYGK